MYGIVILPDEAERTAPQRLITNLKTSRKQSP